MAAKKKRQHPAEGRKNELDVSRESAEDLFPPLSKLSKPEIVRFIRTLRQHAAIGALYPRNPIFRKTAVSYEVLSRLNREAVQEILQTEDRTKLERYIPLIAHLRQDQTPFYTLDEDWPNLLNRFITHLERNMDHLVATGFPKSPFTPSPYLDLHLGKLYYTKIPRTHPLTRVSPTDGADDLRDIWDRRKARALTECRQLAEGDLEFEFAWMRKPLRLLFPHPSVGCPEDTATLALWGEPIVCVYDTSNPKPTDYEHAASLEWLDSKTAERLQRLRGPALHLRLETLRLLLKTFRLNRWDVIEDEVISLFNSRKHLSSDDIRFLMEMEFRFTQFEGRGNPLAEGNWRQLNCTNAGIVNIFILLGHLLQEHRIGMMDRTKQAIHKALPEGLPESYLDALGQPWRKPLDDALDLWLGLEVEAQAYADESTPTMWRKIMGDDLSLRPPATREARPGSIGTLRPPGSEMEDATAELEEKLGISSAPPEESYFVFTEDSATPKKLSAAGVAELERRKDTFDLWVQADKKPVNLVRKIGSGPKSSMLTPQNLKLLFLMLMNRRYENPAALLYGDDASTYTDAGIQALQRLKGQIDPQGTQDAERMISSGLRGHHNYAFLPPNELSYCIIYPAHFVDFRDIV